MYASSASARGGPAPPPAHGPPQHQSPTQGPAPKGSAHPQPPVPLSSHPSSSQVISQQQQQQASNQVVRHRLPELVDALRTEVEHVSQDLNAFRSQKDDFEHKLSDQMRELQTFQQYVFELDKAHQGMKAAYEEEILRLKKELERLNGGPPAATAAAPRHGQPAQQPQLPQHPQHQALPPPTPHQGQRPGYPDAPPPQLGAGPANGSGGVFGALIGAPPPPSGLHPQGPDVQHASKRLRGEDGAPMAREYQQQPPLPQPQQLQQPPQSQPPPHWDQHHYGPNQRPPPPRDYRQEPQYGSHPPPHGQSHYGQHPPPPHHPSQPAPPAPSELKRKTSHAPAPPPQMHHQQPPPPSHAYGYGQPPPAPQPSHYQQPPPAPAPPPPQQQHHQHDPAYAAHHHAAPAAAQPVTGICNLDEVTSPAFRKDREDWSVVYNPSSSSLKRSNVHIELVHSMEHGSVVCCVKFSNDGKFLATGCNRVAQVFDTHTGQKVHQLVAEDAPPANDLYIRSVCFSPDGLLLATGAEDKAIRVWDLRTRKVRFILRGHEQDIYSLDWSRDGRVIVSGSGDRSVRVWDADKGVCLMTLVNEEEWAASQVPGAPAKDFGVTSVAISPLDGSCVAAGSLDRVVRVWDIRTGRLLERFEGHADSVYSVAFSPDGQSVVSGSLDKTLKIWDLSSATLSALTRSADGAAAAPPSHVTVTTACRHTFAGHRDFVLSVAFAGVNGSIGRVDERGNAVSAPGSEALAEVEWVVSASKDRSVVFWDGRTPSRPGAAGPAVAAQFMLHGHKNSVISVALAPSGGLFATGSGDFKSKIWRVSAAGGVPAGPQSHAPPTAIPGA